MKIKKILFGIILVFSLYVCVKLALLYLQPAPKIYETVDGQLYLYKNKKELKLLDARILIANALVKGFENITSSVIQDACSKVGGYYHNGLCYIGKLTIIDGKGVISPGTYYYLTKEQLTKLINACSNGNCPIGYVGLASIVDDFVHYNVSYYKNNVKPRPVGSTVLLKIFNKDDSEIVNVLKNYIAKSLGVESSDVEVEIVNKQLIGKIGNENNLFKKNLVGYVNYEVKEEYSTKAYEGYSREIPQNEWIIGLFNNSQKEFLFLPANYKFNYSIKKDKNYKGFVDIITGCNGKELLNEYFPQYCNYTGSFHNDRWAIFRCTIGDGLNWTTLWSKIKKCYSKTDLSSPKVFYLNYSEAKPGMLTIKGGIKFKFYYPYVDCGYDQAASGTYIVKADGFNIKAITDNVTGNVVKTCVDSNNNQIPCSQLGLKTKKQNKKILKLSGFNGISFKLNLNQQIIRYKAYKIAGRLYYLILVKYNGVKKYYKVLITDSLNPEDKSLIAKCTNSNICKISNVYQYNNKILIDVYYDENHIVYDKKISEIYGEEQ